MNCSFCNSILNYDTCPNHKFIIRFYDSCQICFDISPRYTLNVTKNHIEVYDFYICKYIISINNTFKITPDNAESVLFKLLSLKAFS